MFKRAIILLFRAIQGVPTGGIEIPEKYCCFAPDIFDITHIVEYYKKLT